MAYDRRALEQMERRDLVREARGLAVDRPEVMTRVELVDEILRLTTEHPEERRRVRGFLGLARDLVASVVEQGLNLPDAAALIRGDLSFEPLRPPRPPVATVTLAEIYGAQGHFDLAIRNLDAVLDKEPDHDAARALRDDLTRKRDAKAARKAKSAASAAQDGGPADDVVITLPVEGATYVYWELSPSTAARVEAGDRAVIRVLSLAPTPVGAERSARDIAAAGRIGGQRIEGLTPPSVVRAALGLAVNGDFRVVAVAAAASSTEPGTELSFAPRSKPDYAGFASRAVEHFSRN